jgi:hypothetical protein
MSNAEPQNESSVQNRRGVNSFEYNGRSIFVKADVDKVSAALAKHRGTSQRKTNIADRPVTLAKQCFFVFRFAGHTWTQIIGRDSLDDVNPFMGAKFDLEKLKASAATLLNEGDAKAISSELGTTALYYFVGDTAYGIGYTLYDDGELVEKLEAGETLDEAGEDLGDKCEWQSATGASGPADAYAAMPWVDALFKRLDAFEPGIFFGMLVGYFGHKPGEKVTISNKQGQFERIDFVSV